MMRGGVSGGDEKGGMANRKIPEGRERGGIISYLSQTEVMT